MGRKEPELNSNHTDNLTDPKPSRGVFWTDLSDSEKIALNRRSWIRAFLLFSLTLISTFLVGAGMVTPSPSSSLDFLRGWVFAVPLMGILLLHESGHYIAARRHKVAVSPPYFIPFPNLIGTMGAFISIRSPIKSRKVLLDIGAAGPLAGFLPSIIALVIGYHFSTTGPMISDVIVIEFGDSILTWLIQYAVIGPLPEGLSVWIHPVGLAGWVGLFVTMLNLMPIGQLDGGHIAYALFGRRQWIVAPVMLTTLILLGLSVSRWWWWLLGFLVVLNLVTIVAVRLIYKVKIPLSGLWRGEFFRHPHTPDEKELDQRRRLIGWICIAVFILCFIPMPLEILNLPGV